MTVSMNNDSIIPLGWPIGLFGWVIFFASIFFAVENKSATPPYAIHFWVTFALLTGVSMAYLVARRISARWKSKAVRSYFSPYLIGATIWSVLILGFFALAKFQ